ncbi:thioredoxin-like protein [Pelagophyceae sp. CCMP2097]|nr:thioredoxin-like protein [Pelagophyceae sp. CCMP2097]
MLALGLVMFAVSVGANSEEHRELFGCRRKPGTKTPTCAVQELTDLTWNDFTEDSPHYILLYAPWCTQCKKLVPDLKRLSKKLKKAGISVGACNVEQNPSVQATFKPRGFPTLLLCPNEDPRLCLEHPQPKTEHIVRWAVEQLVDASIMMGEPGLATAAYAYMKTLKPERAEEF